MTAVTEGVQATTVEDAEAFRWGGASMAVGAVLVGLFPLLHPPHDAAAYAGAGWAPIHLLPQFGSS